MIGTINCVYETPCGWCSKWDKKCDSKIVRLDLHCNKDKDLEDIRSGNGLTLADVYSKPLCRNGRGLEV